MSWAIYSEGKNTGNGPFQTKEQAESHCQRLREFAMKKSALNPNYKKAFPFLEILEVKEVK